MQTTTDRPLPFLYTNACSTGPEKEKHDDKTKGKIEKLNASQKRKQKQKQKTGPVSPNTHLSPTFPMYALDTSQVRLSSSMLVPC